MVRLDDADAEWAKKLGLVFGAWYPNPRADVETLRRDWQAHANRQLYDVMIARARQRFAIPEPIALDGAKVTAMLPYLQELADEASRGVAAALSYRNHMLSHSLTGRDPRLEAPNAKSIAKFEAKIRSFLAVRQTLTVHWLTDVSDFVTNDLPRPPAPEPQPYGVSHAGAEQLIAAWMRHLGAFDAEPTRISGDGGIDVASAGYIAQVKNLAVTSAVPVSAIRDLAGVAFVDGRRAAMFTSGAYSSGGVAFADSAGMALFRYDAVAGTLGAVNDMASGVLLEGMGS